MKKKIWVPVVLLSLVFLLTACGIMPASSETEQQRAETYYYEYTGGALSNAKWISFYAGGWQFYTGESGVYTRSGDEVVLQTTSGAWATGTFSGDRFTLKKDGTERTFGTTEEAFSQDKKVFTIYAVYNAAVDLGFEGTLEELIAMFHGTDGKSAYELAVGKGYRGTEAEWLASLAGADGSTPIIGTDGHWYVGGIDTGVAAAGAGIVSIAKTATNSNIDTYTITMSDGRTYDYTVTNGLNGEAAAMGTGIEKIEKTSTVGLVDTYTVSLTDGTSYTFTVTNGRDGVDGVDGVDGIDGINGVDGKDGKDAESPTIQEIYQAAVEAGYAGSFLDFIGEYLTVGSQNETAKISASCFSTVSIVCVYDYNFAGLVLSGTSSGTGIIYSLNKENGDAYVITNYHVVYAAEKVNEEGGPAPGIADKIFVYLYGSEVIGNEFYTNVDYPGMYMEAEYIGGSMNYDLAVLKISGSDRIKNGNAKAVTFADSNALAPADTVYAVGNGGGDGIAVTKGIVNYTSETLSITGSDGVTPVSFRVVRYDAAVNPGNSGGALFNANGELVGVVNAKMVDSKYDNVGYAIPSVVAKNVVENILYYYHETGETPVQVKKLLFGISYTVSESYAEFDEATGKITTTDKLRVASVNDTSLVVGQIEAGDVVTAVKVERGGEETLLQLTRAYLLADLTITLRAGDTVTLIYDRIDEESGETTTGEAVVVVTDENLVVSE